MGKMSREDQEKRFGKRDPGESTSGHRYQGSVIGAGTDVTSALGAARKPMPPEPIGPPDRMPPERKPMPPVGMPPGKGPPGFLGPPVGMPPVPEPPSASALGAPPPTSMPPLPGAVPPGEATAPPVALPPVPSPGGAGPPPRASGGVLGARGLKSHPRNKVPPTRKGPGPGWVDAGYGEGPLNAQGFQRAKGAAKAPPAKATREKREKPEKGPRGG